MARHDKLLSFPLRLPRELDRLFDEIIHPPWGIPGELLEWNPSVDLYETPEAFVLEADLPGVKGEDIKVEVEGSELVIEGRRYFERNHGRARFHYQERSCREFVRRMTLPESVDRDRIEAKFKDGVLKVILPKNKQKGKKP